VQGWGQQGWGQASLIVVIVLWILKFYRF